VEIVSFQPTPAYCALLNHQIDIAMLFHHDYPDSDDIRFHDFAKETLVFMTKKNYPLAQKKFAEIKDLTGCVIVAFRNNYFSDFTQALLRQHDVLPKKLVYSDHIDTMHYTIQETKGVAIVPISAKNINRPELAITRLVGEDSTVNMTMAYRFDNNNPAISLFLKIVDMAFPLPQSENSTD
jgi:DNA-binding transcriptional LysR family regulator